MSDATNDEMLAAHRVAWFLTHACQQEYRIECRIPDEHYWREIATYDAEEYALSRLAHLRENWPGKQFRVTRRFIFEELMDE